MDSVVTFLSTVTKPLTSLKSDKKKSTASSAEPLKLDVSAEAYTDVKPLVVVPPQIPHLVLCLIMNILAVGECSSCTFQQSLTLIQNLSHIPDARDIIAQELKAKAHDCGHAIIADLGDLMNALTSSGNNLNVPSDATIHPPSMDISTVTNRPVGLIRIARHYFGDERIDMLYPLLPGRFTPLQFYAQPNTNICHRPVVLYLLHHQNAYQTNYVPSCSWFPTYGWTWSEHSSSPSATVNKHAKSGGTADDVPTTSLSDSTSLWASCSSTGHHAPLPSVAGPYSPSMQPAQLQPPGPYCISHLLMCIGEWKIYPMVQVTCMVKAFPKRYSISLISNSNKRRSLAIHNTIMARISSPQSGGRGNGANGCSG
ncbi:uncharacterized protein HD556DRAFT_1459787 [Suillus plorans]|uniref:Uncharacterized protein n=1 Tax=Suillus plorans TaxID=116603 RepID=A0A9P7D9E5_9AGAM|nr:uncharacterized protein HD556DRAFT_1459787 [Suillus plorans]KAG1785085.1 hypothetical protein HD556DRAFT_1459787 [Suillus plorans]